MRLKTIASAAVFLFSMSALADVAVIVHQDNPVELTQQQISKIYLGKMKVFPNGEKILPVNQNSSEEMFGEFNEKVVKKSDAVMKSYWARLIFTGKGTPPKEVGSGDDVLAIVSKNPNTIGYIDLAQVNDSVRIIGKF